MNLDETSVYINNTLSEYLDERWLIGFTALSRLMTILSTVKELDNPGLLDLITGAMARIITDMHNISRGRIGSNG